MNIDLQHPKERTEVRKHVEQRCQEETGFTLIELMVVVLIMGILMAIAIPTFLSTRGSADDASAKSNATNAFTSEKSYYATRQMFIDTPANGSALDSSLPWDTTATFAAGEQVVGDVSAFAMVATYTESPLASSYQGPVLVVEALSKANSCFYIIDNESVAGKSFIGYAETSGGCSVSTKVFDLITAPAGPTSSASGTAIPPAASGITAATNWYQTW